MKNLKQLVNEINKESPNENDLRYASFKDYYLKIRSEKDKKKFRRLKLLVSLYPEILQKNSFRSVEGIVDSPEGKFIRINTNRQPYAFETHLSAKMPNYCSSYPITFKVSDLYEYYGIG